MTESKGSPLVSVILPTWNSENFISEAIESILSQTYKNFELLIINDGSTDKTSQIIEKYSSSDNRIKHIKREHEGLVSTLNHGK